MKRLLRCYFELVPAGRSRLATVIALSLVSAVFQGASIGLLLPALQMVERPDSLNQSGVIWRTLAEGFALVGQQPTLGALLTGVLLLILLGQGMFYAQQHLSAGMSRDFVTALRRHAFEALFHANMGFHYRSKTGSLVSYLTQDVHRTGAVFESVLQLIGRGILIVFYAAMLFLLSWQSSAGVIALVAGVSWLVYLQTVRSKQIGPRMVEANRDLYSFAVERLGAVRMIKLRNTLQAEVERFGELSKEAAGLKCRHERQAARIRLLMEPSLAGSGVLAVYVGYTYFAMSLSQLGVILFVLVRMVPEAYTLNRLRHAVTGYVGHFDNVLRGIGEAAHATSIAGGVRPFPALGKAITFTDVTVRYEGGKPALQGVNLVMEAGCMTAIVGPSGAGKSTLLDLVVRLLDPQEGKVLLDGVDIREFDLTSLRRAIGFVSQDVLLLNDTVIENIRYGRPEASDSEVIEAAVRANAHGFIEALPQGYRTVVGSRGMTLSGGERQRLELARALVRKPLILLLDEPTSGLDAESERQVLESVLVAAEGLTVVFVTHRMSAVRNVHKVIVLDAGQVAEEGSPETLAQSDGVFSHYRRLQLSQAGRPK